MDMLVVYPAYWKRGYGTKLVKWSIDLSEIDGVVQGVSATAMVQTLYKQLDTVRYV